MEPLALVVFIILVALAFDFSNRLHAAANSIATVVSPRVLTPTQAVVWAAFFNFVAAFGFGVSVARTIGKGIIHPEIVDSAVILAALVGAIAWNIITWYGGGPPGPPLGAIAWTTLAWFGAIPASSSHARIGGLAGAGIAKAGFGSLVPAGLVKTGVFIVLSPLLGLVVGFSLMVGGMWLFLRSSPSRGGKLFRRLQLVPAGV